MARYQPTSQRARRLPNSLSTCRHGGRPGGGGGGVADQRNGQVADEEGEPRADERRNRRADFVGAPRGAHPGWRIGINGTLGRQDVPQDRQPQGPHKQPHGRRQRDADVEDTDAKAAGQEDDQREKHERQADKIQDASPAWEKTALLSVHSRRFVARRVQAGPCSS